MARDQRRGGGQREAPVSWRRQDRDTALGSDREAVSVASAEG